MRLKPMRLKHRLLTAAVASVTAAADEVSAAGQTSAEPFVLDVTDRSGLDRLASRVAELGTPGTPVGLVDEPSFSTVQHLLRDETITFYTDGVSEARGTAGMYGEARLLELVRQLAHDPQVITEEIAREALDFQAGVASDDIAIVTFAAETQ